MVNTWETHDRHMTVIPFPVCEYAATYYKEGRQLADTWQTHGRHIAYTR